MWLDDDGFEPEIIELALAEMQRNDIRSIRYIDSILLNWKRKKIFTVDAAKRSLLEFRDRKLRSKTIGDNIQPETVNPAKYHDWIGDIKKKLK